MGVRLFCVVRNSPQSSLSLMQLLKLTRLNIHSFLTVMLMLDVNQIWFGLFGFISICFQTSRLWVIWLHCIFWTNNHNWYCKQNKYLELWITYNHLINIMCLRLIVHHFLNTGFSGSKLGPNTGHNPQH